MVTTEKYILQPWYNNCICTVAIVTKNMSFNPLTPVDTFMCHITLYPQTPNDTFMCHNGAREI